MKSILEPVTITHEDFARVYRMFVQRGNSEEIVTFLIAMTALTDPEMSYDECAVYVMFMLSDVIAERSAS